MHYLLTVSNLLLATSLLAQSPMGVTSASWKEMGQLMQGGWSKCEKTKGVYDWQWLDTVILDAATRGVAPWVELSYGNPIYEGGGEAKLAGHIPTSPETLAAWDNWVRAIVTRYKNQVTNQDACFCGSDNG